jgi:outer membrane protein assembly factor BamB
MNPKFLTCLKMFVVLSVVFTFQATFVEAGDWPQYRADAGRTGYTQETLPEGLGLKWMSMQKAPTPAWTGIHTRMIFDYAYHPVISGDMLYFGSSTDTKVYALDAATGEERWAFFTNASVRLAPAVWQDKVFAISDDGALYCLSAANGELIWKKDAPKDEYKLGNDRMVSNWPARGGIAIKDDVLYYGVGIWPTDEIYIYALNPETGDVQWVNDKSGSMFWKQPHGTASAESGISAQGYLAVNSSHVFVPTGRAIPAGLKADTGELDYYHLQQYRNYGGSRLFANDDYFIATSGNTRDYNEIIGRSHGIFKNEDGQLLTANEFNSPGLVISPDFVYYVNSQDYELKAHSLKDFTFERQENDRKGKPIVNTYLADPVWTLQTIEPADTIAMIMAGDKIVAGTENNKVSVINTTTKTIEWATEVDGVPYALAVANGNLYVGTDKGTLYCFDGSQTANPTMHVKNVNNTPYSDNAMYAKAAEEIVRKSGVTRGYALDVNCGDGALAYELAKRTNLYIIAIDDDPANVAAARQKLDAAGLYGTRVVVQQSDLDATRYPKYFANLIVSGESVQDGADLVNTEALVRVQRPEGGVMMFGKVDEMQKNVRPALAGAGEWTHLYSDPANTISSGDSLIKGDLEMLWWNDPAFTMPSRHGRGVGPLYKDGLMYTQGVDGIQAHDAYNGHLVWEYFIEDLGKPYDQDHLLGAAITHGNYAIDGDKMYVRLGMQQYDRSFRFVAVLNAKTGKLLKEIRVPEFEDPAFYEGWANRASGSEGYWGYLAVDNGTIYGSIVNADHIVGGGYRESDMSHQYSESRAFFVMDAETEELKWMYVAENSIRHNAIAIGGGKVFLVDRPLALQDRLRHPAEDTKTLPKGKLVALNAETGETLYEQTGSIYGTLLALSPEHDVLIMTQQYTRFKVASEIGGQLAAFRASTGERLWDIDVNVGENRVMEEGVERPLAQESREGQAYPYASRPIILESRSEVFLEPYTFDLLTGEQKDIVFDRSYNCGMVAAAESMLVYRSATFGYVDMENWQKMTQNWGGFRPACWINSIPAGGIVMVPQGMERCDCSYLMSVSLALAPKE